MNALKKLNRSHSSHNLTSDINVIAVDVEMPSFATSKPLINV